MKRFLTYFFVAITTLGLLGVGAIFGVYIWASRDLPSITKAHDYQLPLVTTVYARDGSVMGYFYDEKRFLVNLERMPPHLINAFFAAEDADFFQHHGVNPKAILRAFVANLRSGDSTQGGSTITQQVVKRLLLTPEKTYERKIKEAILSYQLEKFLGKEQILYLYLNQIFFGNNAYGVEAAARTYFAKHVEDLTLAESAVLAGLPKAPSRNNPYREPENIKSRQMYVLGQMLDKNFITEAEYQAATVAPLEYKSMPEPSWTVGSWYLEEVRRQLIEFLKEENVQQYNLPLSLYGKEAVYQGGLHVYTAMEPVHQIAAETALRAGLHAACQRRGWRGPVEHLSEDAFAAFNKNNPFTPETLADAGWAKGLVTAVSKDKAEVALGEYKGAIAASTVGWARTPNTNVSPEGAGKVRDITKVVSVGDVIWVSAVGAEGAANPVSIPASTSKNNPVPAYNAATVSKTAPIPLALEQMPDLQGAVASIDVAAGDLVAIAGGYAFSPESQFNRATQALRQPGSSFKPVVYSAALDNGLTAGSILLDSPFALTAAEGRTAWTPGNFDGKFLGPILLRTALAKSRNACTVRVAQRIGMPAIIQRARDLGIPGDIPEVLAVSLGSYEATPLTMAVAYTAFANQGKRIKPRIVTEIKDNWGNTVATFNPDVQEAISPQNAYIMAHLLKEVVNAGTGAQARVLGRPVGGKTGTSNDERDAWFIGFSPYLVTSVFLGYDNNTPMGRMETGGRAALPVFIKYRQAVDPLFPPSDFPVPEGITMATVDAHSGYLAGPGSTESYTLPFISGTEPSGMGGDALQRGDEDTENSVELLKQNF